MTHAVSILSHLALAARCLSSQRWRIALTSTLSASAFSRCLSTERQEMGKHVDVQRPGQWLSVGSAHELRQITRDVRGARALRVIAGGAPHGLIDGGQVGERGQRVRVLVAETALLDARGLLQQRLRLRVPAERLARWVIVVVRPVCRAERVVVSR